MFKDLYQVLEYAWSLLFDQRGEAGEGEGEAGQGSGEGEGSAAGGQGEEEGQTVPVSALQAVREELQGVKEQLQASQDQIRLYQANPPQGGQQQQQQGQVEQGTEGLAGMEDDDVITVADAKKLAAGLEARVGAVIGEMAMAAQNPDYNDVITNHLPKVIQANPALAQAIKSSQNPYVLAYELGKTNPEYVKKLAEKGQQETITTIEENLAKPGSASAAGGGGGGISKADQYAQMSDDDLEKEIDAVKKRG